MDFATKEDCDDVRADLRRMEARLKKWSFISLFVMASVSAIASFTIARLIH
jgi:hypothetical protein